MEKYRTLPFAMYDLAVYLPGGAVILVLTKAAIEAILGYRVKIFVGSLSQYNTDVIDLVIRSVIWLSASYLAGHLASFISTYIVEKPVHHYFGYPSGIWLEFEQKGRPGSLASDVQNIILDNFKKSIIISLKDKVQVFVLFLQIPAIPFFTLILLRRAFGFYSPKLPLGLISNVKKSYNSIGVDITIDKGTRWEKIVEHHVANNCPSAYSRMYNYLVIYGALRLLSMILLMICWYFILLSIISIISVGETRFDIFRSLIFTMSAASYTLAVMAFAKFNRRYFEETIMALLLAK